MELQRNRTYESCSLVPPLCSCLPCLERYRGTPGCSDCHRRFELVPAVWGGQKDAIKINWLFPRNQFFVQFTHQTNYPRYKHLTKSVNKPDEIIMLTDQKTRPAAFRQPSWYFIRLFLLFSHLPGGGKLLNSSSCFTGFYYWHSLSHKYGCKGDTAGSNV